MPIFTQTLALISNMKVYHLILLSILFVSCGESNSSTEQVTEGPTFEDYYNKIPQDTLPYHLDCGHAFLFFDISYAVYEKYIPEGGWTYTKFKTESKHPVILYTFPGDLSWPYLYSFSENGEIIDSLGLYIGSCQSDPYSDSRCYAIFNEDLTIELSDTVNHYSITESVQTYDSSTVKTQIYQFSTEGEFELSSENVLLLE